MKGQKAFFSLMQVFDKARAGNFAGLIVSRYLLAAKALVDVTRLSIDFF